MSQPGVAARMLTLQRGVGNKAVQRIVGDGAAARRPARRTLARKFVARGNTTDFEQMVNRILEVQHEIRVGSAGDVRIDATNVPGPPTRDASELLDTIRTVIDDPRTTTIEFIRGAISRLPFPVVIGDLARSLVDLDDLEQFGFESSHSSEGTNAASLLVREITRQYRRQAYGDTYDVANAIATSAMDRLHGGALVEERGLSYPSPWSDDVKLHLPWASVGEASSRFFYDDGRELEVIWSADHLTGNVVHVERRFVDDVVDPRDRQKRLEFVRSSDRPR